MAGVDTQPRYVRDLRAVLAYLTRNPHASYRAIMRAVGWRSIGKVTRALDGLEHRGYIRRHCDRDGRVRSCGIEVIYPLTAAYEVDGQRFMFIPVGR